MNTSDKSRCFVIMPFSATSDKHTDDYWTQHFECFLKPLIEECNDLKAIRSEPLRGDILRQIITDLAVSPIVVADLTDYNPNVFWELGVRHSFKHCTVTIAEHGTKLPFDLSAKGTLFYFPNDHIKNETFKRKCHSALQDCFNNPDAPDSPVLETFSGRGSFFEIIRKGEILRRLEAIKSEIKWNTETLDRVLDVAGRDLMTFRRLRHAAVELLITERYLSADSSFYKSAEAYFDLCVGTNERLGTWLTQAGEVKEWFKEKENGLRSVFQKFDKMIDQAYSEVAKRL
jgi:hypothetical protein